VGTRDDTLSRHPLCALMTRIPTVVFLDRDGTIIRDVSYLSRADDVELLPGAAGAIARLNARHIPVIVITNQSGIARGRFTVEDYLLTQQRLDDLLATDGARVDATYYCPDHPDFTGPCSCRKPGTALFQRAATEHSLDVASPAFVGDRWRDVEPFHELGGTPVLISGPNTPGDDLAAAVSEAVTITASLAEAVDVLIGAGRS
jgi:D-glycero-D-manno-heptose 1,7-bisphosphate phosphatase